MEEYNTVLAQHTQYLGHEKDAHVLRGEEELLEAYSTLLSHMSEAASGSVGDQDLTKIGSGVVLCIQALFLVSTHWSYNYSPRDLLSIPILGLLQYFDYATPVNILLLLNTYLMLAKFKFEIPEVNGYFFNDYLVPLTFFSSSYVEEEHSIRYYLWASVMIWFLFFPSPEAESKSKGSGDE
jgi:hypothetical protein